jgi:oligopeptide transport system substrate-binding protein
MKSMQKMMYGLMTVKIMLSTALILLMATGSIFAGGKKDSTSVPGTGGEVLNIQIDGNITTLDFHGSQYSHSLTAMYTIGEGLHYLDGNEVFQLGLAESYTRSPDGLTLTYKIREARWSDGSPLTAHDFVYSWRRLGDPAVAADYRRLLNIVTIENAQDVISGKKPLEALGVKALDDRTLVITLTTPVAFTEGLFSFPAFFPLKQSLVEAKGAKFATSPDTILSIGAFKPKIYEPNTEVTEVERNPYYYRASEIKLDGIRFQTIADIQQAVLAYQSGLVDILPRLSGEQIDLYKDDPEFQTELGPYVWYLTPNTRDNKYLANINVRRALALSIDREALTKNILRDGSVPAEYLVARGLAKAPDDQSDFQDGGAGVGDELHFNREAALRFWNQAKQESNFSTLTLEMIVADTSFSSSIAQFLQAQFQNLPGLTIRIAAMPTKSRGERQRAGEFDLSFHGWGGDYRDPLTFLDLWLSDQHVVYRNKDYDAIVVSAGRGELARDLPRRFRELRRAEQIALRDIATIPILQTSATALQKLSIKGVEYHGVQGGTTYIWASKSPSGIAGR